MPAEALYVRRLAAMLLAAMPLAVVLLALTELFGGAGRSALDLAAGAAGLVYVWGGFTGVIVSVIHTLAARRVRMGTGASIVLAATLGLIGGAFTPTLFTGLFESSAIALGGFAGLVYGGIIALARDRLDAAKA